MYILQSILLQRQLNMNDSNDILFFGSKAQKQLTTISDSMLEGVKNKELGTAGDSLNEMVGVLRGFDVAGLDPNDPSSWGDVGRNAPCPCGSGKKFKQCHGAA